ncbi:MAG: LLM class F420-dependent oxidoreductase [Acidimicrobiales bacterium]|jgi:probable F420-dependent oxidoreductase
MKFGLAFANIGPFVEPEAAVALAVAAEAAGFESIWTVDHVVVPAGYQSKYPYDPSGKLPSGEATVFPDPLIWLSYVAARTSTLRLATGILIVPQRNPLVLAKELASLDYLSGGRMILGAGIGWLEEEFDALGVPFAGRGERTDESIAAMRALWSEHKASYEGSTTEFRDCFLRPQPPGGTIPVHVGGHSEASARRAGRIGDGFFPLGVTRDGMVSLMKTMRESAEGAGRDPAAIEVTVQCNVTAGEEALAELAGLEGLGATRVVVPAVMFREDLVGSLQRYGVDVIGRA